MSDYERCEKCGQWDWLSSHKCYSFQVYYPEYYGEEWETVWGKDAENVVEIIAEMLNEDQPEFDTDIFETPITVKDINGKITAFNCTASISVDYSTKEVLVPEDLPE